MYGDRPSLVLRYFTESGLPLACFGVELKESPLRITMITCTLVAPRLLCSLELFEAGQGSPAGFECDPFAGCESSCQFQNW